jgi:UDP-N-acetylmuramate dehydrogenase
MTLPPVRGKCRLNADLSTSVWFQAGGPAAVLFRPEDADDLAGFLRAYRGDLPILPLGLGSNLLVRSGGIKAVVVRLGKGFAGMRLEEGNRVYAGAGAPAANAARFAAENGVGGLEFMIGIPGAVGGLVAMNAGAYGNDMASVVLAVDLMDRDGTLRRAPVDGMGYAYRTSALPEQTTVVGALLQGVPSDPERIRARMAEIMKQREESQPVRGRTGGSTFKNPEGDKAWRLIDKAGCRGLRIGGAQMSEKHCNFMLNTGGATSDELEELGETVRRRVCEDSGVMLEWEIKRVGRPGAGDPSLRSG